MAYLTITRIGGEPGDLLESYRASAERMAAVGRDHGLILHAVAATEGGLLIVNLWPSREGSEAAAADPRRAEVVQAHGLRPDRFAREHHEVERYLLLDSQGRLVEDQQPGVGDERPPPG